MHDHDQVIIYCTPPPLLVKEEVIRFPIFHKFELAYFILSYYYWNKSSKLGLIITSQEQDPKSLSKYENKERYRI